MTSSTPTIKFDEGMAYTDFEGVRYEMPVDDLDHRLAVVHAPPGAPHILPEGVAFMRWRRPYLVVVHQQPPMVRQFRWIANNSAKPYGAGATYRPVRLSLPYVVSVSSYRIEDDGRTANTGNNELFFRNKSLRHITDSLSYPSLLNVSVVGPKLDRTWVCTQYLKYDKGADWQTILDRLLDHLWNGSFNWSSEHHEGNSWFSKYKKQPSIYPVENWEKASQESARFGYKYPNWITCPYNLSEVIQNIFTQLGVPEEDKLKNLQMYSQLHQILVTHGKKTKIDVEIEKKSLIHPEQE